MDVSTSSFRPTLRSALGNMQAAFQNVLLLPNHALNYYQGFTLGFVFCRKFTEKLMWIDRVPWTPMRWGGHWKQQVFVLICLIIGFHQFQAGLRDAQSHTVPSYLTEFWALWSLPLLPPRKMRHFIMSPCLLFGNSLLNPCHCIFRVQTEWPVTSGDCGSFCWRGSHHWLW